MSSKKPAAEKPKKAADAGAGKKGSAKAEAAPAAAGGNHFVLQ
jgi:hypothetical protein